jgi:hypothetical protein
MKLPNDHGVGKFSKWPLFDFATERRIGGLDPALCVPSAHSDNVVRWSASCDGSQQMCEGNDRWPLLVEDERLLWHGEINLAGWVVRDGTVSAKDNAVRVVFIDALSKALSAAPHAGVLDDELNEFMGEVGGECFSPCQGDNLAVRVL